MYKYHTKKQEKYYNKVITLFYEKDMAKATISQLFPVGADTISSWIRNFAEENPNDARVMKKNGNTTTKRAEEKPCVPSKATSDSIANSTDVKELQAEIARLKEDLRVASLRADIFDEMINVAEKQFNIPIYCCPLKLKMAKTSNPKPCKFGLRAYSFKK